MELKHDPSIIAALASETAILYEKCSKFEMFYVVIHNYWRYPWII